MKEISFKRRMLLLVAVWLGVLAVGSAVFFLMDGKDARYYLLAVWLFPVGLTVYVPGMMGGPIPPPVNWVLWAGYLGFSGWMLSVKKRGVFLRALGVLGLVAVLNIGGCAYGMSH